MPDPSRPTADREWFVFPPEEHRFIVGGWKLRLLRLRHPRRDMIRRGGITYVLRWPFNA